MVGKKNPMIVGSIAQPGDGGLSWGEGIREELHLQSLPDVFVCPSESLALTQGRCPLQFVGQWFSEPSLWSTYISG